jgi:hypothetical protein
MAGSDLRFQGFGVKSYRVHDGVSLDTVTGLQQWEVLGGQCAKCGRISWLEKRAVERKVGNQYLLNLRGKLKCECGNKQGNDVLIGYLDRNL